MGHKVLKTVTKKILKYTVDIFKLGSKFFSKSLELQ